MSHTVKSKQISTPVISVSDLFFSFNLEDWALQDINVEIHDKEFVGIVGPNGGGKTTFLKLILGLLKPDKGSVRINGKNVRKGRASIGYFPQIKEIDSDFPITVKEVILEARLNNKIVNFVSKRDRQVANNVMEVVDIYHLRDRRLNELSGGQRNRVFLARALACEPSILVLDEPMAGLDVALQRMFLDTLQSLNSTMTIVIVDHNLRMLEEYVDKFICLNRCVAHGINTHRADELPNNLESGECNE